MKERICNECGKREFVSNGLYPDDEYYCEQCTRETCCECGRMLNIQTDECFTLENGDIICEDCVDYQIYTEEME